MAKVDILYFLIFKNVIFKILKIVSKSFCVSSSTNILLSDVIHTFYYVAWGGTVLNSAWPSKETSGAPEDPWATHCPTRLLPPSYPGHHHCQLCQGRCRLLSLCTSGQEWKVQKFRIKIHHQRCKSPFLVASSYFLPRMVCKSQL